jgi:EAL domain-containing protein (putative c-di-GMP-specific phosphodiesterase class I)
MTLALPSELQTGLDPDLLDEAAIEAGCTTRGLSFEMCERALIASNAELAEEMRARGWGVVLRGDPACPLPLSKRARLLYSELILDAPETPGPFLGLAREDRSPLSQRIAAAAEAGIIITAESVRNAAQAKMLAIAGFDRGGGPFAEAGLR